MSEIYTNYFGIISEGQTDYPVIKNLLVALFGKNYEIENKITSIRPQPKESYGWERVFASCRAGEVEQALQTNKYLIIQMDTDIADKLDINVKLLKESNEFFVESLVDAFIDKITEALGKDQLLNFQERIFFAICVNKLECWLLPLFSNIKTVYSSYDNCLFLLQNEINKKNHLNQIKLNSKKATDYEKISSEFLKLKKKNLDEILNNNLSLKIFTDNLMQNVEIEPFEEEEF